MNLYLTGHNPHDRHAYALFLRAAVLLERDGHTVHPTPEQIAAVPNKDTFPTNTDGTYDYRGTLGRDLQFVCVEANAVLVLPGWRSVPRARAAVAAARTLSIPVHEVTQYLLYGDRADHVGDGN